MSIDDETQAGVPTRAGTAKAQGFVATAVSADAGTASAAASVGIGVRTTTTAPVYLVGNATLPSGAIRVPSMQAVPWTTLPPGSTVLVSPGSYAGVTTITATGCAALPIVIKPSDASTLPILTDTVDFQHSAYVQVSHLGVQSAQYAGFLIRQGSHHVTVADSRIAGATDGVNITDGAGTGHQILRNVITDSRIDGINLEVNSDPAERTLVQHNTILRSAQHGIELRASHYQVDYNVIAASGQNHLGGTSGIHVYSGSPSEDSGDDNLVRWNMSHDNIDPVAVDGNGIEIDQWCDGNTVADNVVWGNDGAGVIVFDGSHNDIRNNTAWDDGLDSGHTHVARGELIVSGTAAATVTNNGIWDSLMASTRADVPAMYADPSALAGANRINLNLYSNTAGGTLLRWGNGSVKQTAAAIDAATGHVGNATIAPTFADTTQPLAHGLRLAALPAQHGIFPGDVLDMLDIAPQPPYAFFGAYYKAP